MSQFPVYALITHLLTCVFVLAAGINRKSRLVPYIFGALIASFIVSLLILSDYGNYADAFREIDINQNLEMDEQAGLLTLDGLIIETAILMGEKAYVTINGQTFTEGDQINNALIEKIDNEQITFKVGKTRIIKDVGT
mgnify:CR=1 FL=1